MDTASLVATGARLAAITVTETVPLAVPPRPSLIVYVNESGPEYPAAGVYVTVFSAFTAAVPCAGTDARGHRQRITESGSESLANTLTVTAVS